MQELIISNLDTFLTIISGGLTIAVSIVSPKLIKYKKLFSTLLDAVEDDKITKEELKKLISLVRKI